LTIVGQSARSLAEVAGSTLTSQVSSLGVPTVQPWAGYPGDWLPPLWGSQLGGMSGQYVSTVYTCVDLNSRQLASFPVYRMRGTEHLEDLPWMLNPEPELYADWSDFMKQLANTLWLRGEAIIYALARYDLGEGSVARMMVLNPDHINVEYANGEVVYELAGKRLERADICHIRYQSWPGSLRGISPLQWVGRNLIGAEALERYQAELAAGGGVPWAVLTAPGNLTAEQSAENRERWLEASRARRTAPVMLSGGMRLDTLTLSPADMALLDLRVFDEQRICAAFGVPPYLVGLPQSEGLTYANASSLFDYHWRATLRPKAQHIAAALSQWALPMGQRIEFNADEYVRGDLPTRAAAYAVLHGIVDEYGQHAITVDEIRQGERFTTVPPAPNSGAALTGPVGPAIRETDAA
jgi:HK97 family phage portal protein